MSFYDNQSTWSTQGRQQSWEQSAPPSRSGATSASSNEPAAFLCQIEEVDRAVDNLVKSGKHFAGAPGSSSGSGMPSASRRESMPMTGRGGYGEFDQRPGGPSRHHSVHEYDGSRSGSANGLQGFYAAQRFQPRQSEAEQMMQAKRRMAAQRERELRNYHQEQQYNRNAPGVKSERSMSPSPNAMNEEERRELIARQHRALYGSESGMYNQDGTPARPSQDARLSVSGSVRGPSPLAFDPFGMQAQSGAESAVQMPPREHAGLGPERRSSGSPATGNPAFSMAESAQQTTRTAGSPPSNNSPSVPQGSMPTNNSSGVAPIGTRPVQAQAAAKRSTTPNERSASAASTAAPSDKGPVLGGWGSNSGVWGASKNTLGVQASVWG